MNNYETKVAAKRERFATLATQSEEEASRLYKEGTERLQAIPFGQPILVGHHSEKADRNYRSKAVSKIEKSFAIQDKAEYYKEKAENYGTHAISSDDDNSIIKLEAKLERLTLAQRNMVKVNALIRKNDIAELTEYAGERATKILLTPDFMGRVGFPSFKLTNNSAMIRATKKRIDQLKKASTRETVVKEYEGFTIRYDREENRIMILFPAVPSAEVRGHLKSYGFKWSPTRSAWVRMLNANGIYTTKLLLKHIQ